MDILKNLSVNLKATGPAAVICVWCICVVILGIFGSGSLASTAMGLLTFAGGAILSALALRA
jgi:hypothetical protein